MGNVKNTKIADEKSFKPRCEMMENYPGPFVLDVTSSCKLQFNFLSSSSKVNKKYVTNGMNRLEIITIEKNIVLILIKIKKSYSRDRDEGNKKSQNITYIYHWLF